MAPMCALCGRSGEIRQSHIIPKFASRWIKRTAATGYLASAADAAKRAQDGVKVQLLCGDCEELFSKYEKHFAENVFCPFHDKGARSFNYDKNLALFAASLSWRSLKTTCGEAARDRPNLATAIDRAEACLRGYLLGKRGSIEPYESHLVFVGNESSCGEFHANKWYTTRSIDSTLVPSNGAVFAYSLLPRMAVVTSILPATMDGWLGTSIKPDGKIETSQRVDDPVFWEFVRNRALQALTLSPGPSDEVAERRLKRAWESNKLKALNSESMDIVMEEMYEKMGMEMRSKAMPKTIIALVEDVMKKAGVASGGGLAEDREARWCTREVAQVLAALPKNEAEAIDREIKEVIYKAMNAHVHEAGLVKTSHIWVVFMVHHGASRVVQHKKIHDELTSLESQRTGDRVPIAIFSMNVEDGGCSYESGFCI